MTGIDRDFNMENSVRISVYKAHTARGRLLQRVGNDKNRVQDSQKPPNLLC